MNIKNYPEFTPLAADMKELFDEAFLKSQPFISEFTFTNLYCWKDIYKFSVSIYEGLIILRSDASEVTKFFPPIGIGQQKTAVEKIIKDTKNPFIRLPETIAKLFEGGSSCKVTLDRDNSDYLYKTEELRLLKGKKYDAKRNFIKKFKSLNEYEYVRLNSFNAEDCFDFEERWCLIKDCDNVEGLNNERQAIRKMIERFGDFNLIGAAIKVKGAICAVAIAEKLNQNTLVMHVLKADFNLQGLYQVMLNEFLVNDSGSFEYVNLEQDLGVDGLRKAKLSYHPFKIIGKYTVSCI
ncbi:MAG: phosphatidylglycerol lysyltransferase domain-containing protein [Candidatus Omnitrophota bacterium]